MTGRPPISFRAGAWWRVAIGGAVGAGMRWAVVALSSTDSTFPWATLVVNVAGCLVVGLLVGAPAGRRLGAGVGFAGGLTTFSTVSVELATLLRESDAATAAGYLAASLVLGAGAVALGARLARTSRADPGAPA